jgi:tRNA modification GTPase
VVEASIDFPEEDIELSSWEELCAKLTSARQKADNLLCTFEDGVKIVEGANVVIAGKPNVGKSTLLNAILEKDVAIVTPVAGTTRDVLRESLILQGITLNVFDTAGIRTPRGVVEKEGVKRSKQALEAADLVLFVLDADAGVSDMDRRIFTEIEKKRQIIVINKIDLAPGIDEALFAAEFGDAPKARTSALRSDGIEDLKRLVSENVWSADIPSGEQAILTSVRHRDALKRAKDALDGALKAFREGLSPEFPAVEIRESLDALGSITGETTDDEILHKIFSTFCIGK